MPEHLLPFFLFTLAGSITPGPNNMIATASGATFGLRRTIPQMLGVTVGYPLMLVAFGFGLGELLRHAPWLHQIVRIAGAGFLLYLAWRIASAVNADRAEAQRPVTFFEALVFQWLNPKAWAVALSAVAAFTTPDLAPAAFAWEIGIFALVSAVLAFLSLAMWCLFGVGIASALADPGKRRAFQFTLAGLLAASIVFLFV